MIPTHLLGLVGTPGAGKSHAADYIIEQYGGEHIKFSEYLSHVLHRMSLAKSRENMIKLSVILRKEFGEDIFSHAVAADALQSDRDVVLIDGIRRVEDLAAFKALPNFKLIAINADPNVRYERIRGRKEKTDDSEITWEQFLKTEQAPTEVTIPETMTYANFTIMNNGSVEDYEKQIDDIMKELDIKKRKSFVKLQHG
ncbi:AAA family ATPase [Candidatus Uhrbacteria bacterium]|nr:AAA family ATPase [Candidatus Uhrbacteria bacterium]MBD3284188.1 AAA family ATPase [Candidatus Uhrbacteria bacterium]